MGGVISGRDGLAATPIQTDSSGRLIVRGEDQLFSFHDTLEEWIEGNLTIDGGSIQLPDVPADEWWCVTCIMSIDMTTATIFHTYARTANTSVFRFGEITRAIAINEYVGWKGEQYAGPGDNIGCFFQGGLIGDTCRIFVTGYRMTVET